MLVHVKQNKAAIYSSGLLRRKLRRRIPLLQTTIWSQRGRFFIGAQHPWRYVLVMFRRLNDTSTPADVRGEMVSLRQQILVLEAATADYRRKAPRGLTPIEEISRRFRGTAPVNITGLAKALGLAVRQANLGPQIAGEIFPDLYRGRFCGFTIRVNASDSTRQKRLTVAHEIAHFLRPRDRINNRLVDDRMY